MAHLTRAHNELFRRSPDEQYANLEALTRHCNEQRERSEEKWNAPSAIRPELDEGTLTLRLGEDGVYRLNDWSFTQVCGLAKVSKDTVNKLRPETAVAALRETLPAGSRPIQALVQPGGIRSIHGASYTRLHNADLLDVVREVAGDFCPPQQAITGASGLYCGEQDMFCFLIDPTGWTEIQGEAFAPGFFLWNSEVGKRSIGVQTFWFQAICRNHIVWDAVEVVEFTRKHTARVHDSLNDIRRIIEHLVWKRDERRDGFVRVIENAMRTRMGTDAEEVLKALHKHGIPRNLAREAIRVAGDGSGFSLFAVIDALTRMAGKLPNAGDRIELDTRASGLLALAA
ncbi:MAG: DUF932 domain-containing protein [Candidatus Hydrogenedentes bacterium]|nr:DUF932 domain-containing protein [Candidatus Hydrogenedentota bacterium]